HRLTKPASPQTNGMVERVNRTIKSNTILKHSYNSYDQMHKDLFNFMCNYNLYRRHGSLRKELDVKTPIQAIYKWYQLEPEIFIVEPKKFENKLLNLQDKINQLPLTTL
ncbi:integrase core domain-containing protein, partial [Crocinitomix catalasitica]|uniref:integrase core domain-containing protein n=2 Tax=Crocinitomix catalasitica TaxID=184607 RepID=UPI0012FB8A21